MCNCGSCCCPDIGHVTIFCMPVDMQAAVKSLSQKGRGTKRKPQPTVRERLTKKLLSGKARGQTLGEVESAADERFQEVNSNRWQATRFP